MEKEAGKTNMELKVGGMGIEVEVEGQVPIMEWWVQKKGSVKVWREEGGGYW